MEQTSLMEEYKDGTKKPTEHPYKKANIFSKLFFIWLMPLLCQGYKRDITEDDIYPVLNGYNSKILGGKLKKEWAKELKKRKNDPSLWSALVRVFRKEIILLGMWYVILEIVVKLCQPIALAKLLEYYEPGSTMTRSEGYGYTAFMVLAGLVPLLIHHNYMLRQFLLGRKIKIATSALVYEKSLKLSQSALAETTIGKMVNLISNDVGRFDQVTQFLQDLWVVPLQITIVLILIYFYVGPTGMVGFVLVLAFIPFQVWLGKKASVYRLSTALKTDERIRLMNEIVTGVQVIKMYTWEKPFAALVELSRKKEIEQIRKASFIRGISGSFNLFLTRISIYMCVLTYFYTGNILTAKYVFVLTSMYGIVQQSLTFRLPKGAMQFAEASISVRRIREFLLYPEIENDNKEDQNESVSNGEVKQKPVGIELKNVSAKWVQAAAENVLEDINMSVSSKELAAIIGPVGCGKTTLLHAILKELPPLTGTTDVNGRISYAAQEPWLFVGTVRQNITFGQHFDLQKYQEVVRVCALQRDFTLFPHGDRTIVGERGVSLSGGQRARINLARAVYKDADIYLLDDPLSAVDTHVGKQLFEECITGYLKDKCVVLVTHQLQYLEKVKKIYLLSHGKIEKSGSYDEIRSSSDVFAKLLSKLKDSDEGKSEEELVKPNDKEKTTAKSRGGEIKDDKGPKLAKEGRAHGTIAWSLYKYYFSAGGNVCTNLTVFSMCIITQLISSISDCYLTYWVNMEQLRHNEGVLKSSNNATYTTVPSVQNSTENENLIMEPKKHSSLQNFWLEFMTENIVLITYSVIILLLVFFTLARSIYFYEYCMTASTRLHKNMFDKIVYATMKFFNTNPSGRILNRFSMDMNQVDEMLPLNLLDTIQNALLNFAIIIIISIINPYMLIPTAVILVIFYFIKVFYLATSRDMKRLEGTTRSPVYSHLTATLHGLTTIRAFGAQEILKQELDVYQDTNSSVFYTFQALARWFGLWLDLHSAIFLALVTVGFLFSDTRSVEGGNVGLAITQCITLTAMFQWCMRQWSELENNMTSVERIKEYADLSPEKDTDTIEPPQNWPEEGNVEFDRLCMSYGPDEPHVLKNLTFKIKGKEKIGVVGRTGAGKSSIIVALFRLAENEGNIIIDNVDVTTIKREKLRSSISIIPQEPVLFSGSLRRNLDPFDEYSDAVLWNALEEVELKSAMKELPEGLESKVSEGGSNFSVGQRQLVCLARAIVRKSRILVLDEATANVDPHTDALIQQTIRHKFKECTVITIAHRLHTIMDSDKVLVMDAGQVAEFGPPYELIQNKHIFYEMVQQTGKTMAENLTDVAKGAHVEEDSNKQ